MPFYHILHLYPYSAGLFATCVPLRHILRWTPRHGVNNVPGQEVLEGRLLGYRLLLRRMLLYRRGAGAVHLRHVLWGVAHRQCGYRLIRNTRNKSLLILDQAGDGRRGFVRPGSPAARRDRRHCRLR